MAGFQELVLQACDDVWDKEWVAGKANRNNCSGFVKAVAAAVCVSLPASENADGIIDHVAKSWKKLGSGDAALAAVAAGSFVIAGLRSDDHKPGRTEGHVAIVVAGSLYRGKYPKVWGGSTGAAQSRGDKSTGEVWNTKDRDSVRYYEFQNPSACR